MIARMRLPPTEILLSWPTPNYENPVTRGSALVVVNSIFIGLVIVIVGLRLYTRLVIKRWFGLDDVFILLALVFTIGLTTVVILANQKYGWDRHVYDIPFNKFVPASKIAMAAKVVFTAAATFTRLSLHCFYYRLVSDSGKRWFSWLVHANVVYTIGIFVSFTLLAIFQCNPVKNYWIIGAPADSCMDEGLVTLVCGIINCIADLVTTITPIPLVMGLHMPRRQRIAVVVLFGLGIIVTIAGIIRTWYIYRSLVGEYDQAWYAYPLWIAAAVEIDLGVICASAPVLRSLLANIPSSLPETLSRGISFKRSTDYATNQTPQASRNALNVSVTSSERSEATKSAQEPTDDQSRSYEMKHWDDAERRIMAGDFERSSQEAILEHGDEEPPEPGIAPMWNKIKKRGSKSEIKEDMTITRTSEVKLQSEPAVVHTSEHSSRHTQYPEANDVFSRPALPSLLSRYA